MYIDDKFTFGKYKGFTVRELLRNKNGLYLMWCLDNIKDFHLEPLNFETVIRETYFKQYLLVQKNVRKNKNDKSKIV